MGANTYGYDYDAIGNRKTASESGASGLSTYSANALNQQSTITNYYTWGLDLSGSMQGAGGVGGLLAVTCVFSSTSNLLPLTYYPLYDANGNVTEYVDGNGAVVARREYDAFGNTVSETVGAGLQLPFWFSTKYLDVETGLYYYGYRFYSPELGRWINKDPIKEAGFELATKRTKSRAELEQEAEAELYALLSQVDSALIAQLGLRPSLPQHLLYPFVQNNPLNEFDPFGLSCFTECWKKCIKDNYGKSFDVALGLSYLSVVQIAQDVYNGVVEAAAKEKLKNLNLAGAFTEGDIVKKMSAAQKAASAAKSLSVWTKVLSFLSKATGIVSAGATGYVVGASSYCTGQCLEE